MRRLHILRPEPGASATLDKAAATGLTAVTLPLFRIVPVQWEVPDPAGFDALLLTSANAVRCAGAQFEPLRRLPVHAVGEATASAARAAGFEIATTGEQGVEQLLATVEPSLRLLHICGEHRRIAGATGHAITPVPVYRAEALSVQALPERLSGGVAAVHSPRAGSRLAELVKGEARRTIRVAAISEAAAQAVGAGWEIVEAADAPNEAALLALAARLCQEACRR